MMDDGWKTKNRSKVGTVGTIILNLKKPRHKPSQDVFGTWKFEISKLKPWTHELHQASFPKFCNKPLFKPPFIYCIYFNPPQQKQAKKKSFCSPQKKRQNLNGLFGSSSDFCTSTVATPRSVVLGAAHVAKRARWPRKARAVRRSQYLRYLLGGFKVKNDNFRGPTNMGKHIMKMGSVQTFLRFLGNFHLKHFQSYTICFGWDSGMFGWENLEYFRKKHFQKLNIDGTLPIY